jgi:hypothetical protein
MTVCRLFFDLLIRKNFFLRNLRLKIQKKKFYEKKNVNSGFKSYQVILSSLILLSNQR